VFEEKYENYQAGDDNDDDDETTTMTKMSVLEHIRI
jgi:hypothetical protein